MIHVAVPWVRRTAAILLGLTVALPLAADEARPTAPQMSAGQPTPIRAAASARLLALEPADAALATTQAPATESVPGDQRSFFRTKKGAAALVLLAGGLGYTVYSFSKDRVSSPQR